MSARLTTKSLCRGNFESVHTLKKAIEEFVKSYNSKARPFVWTKDADKILQKISKIKHLLVTGH